MKHYFGASTQLGYSAESERSLIVHLQGAGEASEVGREGAAKVWQ